jgi:RimJ/RimL family protein N-acetyltransferase
MIEYPVCLPVENFRNGKTWHMLSLDENLDVTNVDYQRIVKVCNETPVYEFLFRDRLAGNPYSLEIAHSFIQWANQGWREQTYFVFILKDETGKIMAAIDIKSDNLEQAEIGYWATSEQPGIMTNAVVNLIMLAKQAGYKKLIANTQAQNQRSQGVLIRSGFMLEEEYKKNEKNYQRFMMVLM